MNLILHKLQIFPIRIPKFFTVCVELFRVLVFFLSSFGVEFVFSHHFGEQRFLLLFVDFACRIKLGNERVENRIMAQ